MTEKKYYIFCEFAGSPSPEADLSVVNESFHDSLQRVALPPDQVEAAGGHYAGRMTERLPEEDPYGLATTSKSWLLVGTSGTSHCTPQAGSSSWSSWVPPQE